MTDPGQAADTGRAKQAFRERVWSALEAARVVEPSVAGYIPNFQGAERADRRLAALPAWQWARVLKIVPDRAQLPVRILALEQGKLVYMAAPTSSSGSSPGDDHRENRDPRRHQVPAPEPVGERVIPQRHLHSRRKVRPVRGGNGPTIPVDRGLTKIYLGRSEWMPPGRKLTVFTARNG